MALIGEPERDGMHSLPAGIFQAAQEELFGRGVTKVLPAMLSLMKQRLPLLLAQLSASMAEWLTFSIADNYNF